MLSDLSGTPAPDRRFLVQEIRGEVFEPATTGQLDLYEGRVVLALHQGSVVTGRLWLRRDAAGTEEAKICRVEGEPVEAFPADLRLLGAAV
ncbi:MAG: hypothetical protein JXA67_14620 [Micromonosporaceae bacterium]|nr:hypothetical protein [Micromonosporaceae bacterium]